LPPALAGGLKKFISLYWLKPNSTFIIIWLKPHFDFYSFMNGLKPNPIHVEWLKANPIQ
jgi:hypothetical protein